MATQKTHPLDLDPDTFMAGLEPARRRAEAPVLAALMQRATGASPVIWGGTMVGFGQYEYTYASGHTGTWFLTGFRPAKARITVHVMTGFDRYADALSRLGPHRHAKSCLYLTALDKIDMDVLEEIVTDSVARMRALYPG